MALLQTDSEARLARTFEERRWALHALASYGDGVAIVDEQARLVYFNASALELMGEAPPFSEPHDADGYGVYYDDASTPCPPMDLPLLRALEGTRIPESVLFVRNRARPEGVRLRVSAWCLRDETGRIRGATSVFHELTANASEEGASQRAEAEHTLRDASEEIERRFAVRAAAMAEAHENLVRKERLAVLDQLAGGVAHQIRNPLAAIMNAAYVLKRHLSPEQHPNVEDAIRIIHDEVRHANIIITGLLDYARVRTPDRHPASIVDIVERVLASDWIPSTITIERDIEQVPLLTVDADQLRGALFNVVRNSVEAMKERGTIRVAVRAEEDAVVVTVMDEGPGISPQIRAHLFEPLHSTKPMGIGLGLVTARTFIESHGGRISYVDVPNGACFEIRLPIEP